MCDPVSMTILAVTTAAAGIYAQHKSAEAQEDAIRAQLANLQEESQVTETAEVNDHLRAMRKEQARAKVAAGEAGLQLGSGSIEGILKDSLMQTSLATSATRLNAERERKAGVAEANSQLSTIQKDTVLGAGLKLATAGVQGYVSGSSLQIARTNSQTSAGRKA